MVICFTVACKEICILTCTLIVCSVLLEWGTFIRYFLTSKVHVFFCLKVFKEFKPFQSIIPLETLEIFKSFDSKYFKANFTQACPGLGVQLNPSLTFLFIITNYISLVFRKHYFILSISWKNFALAFLNPNGYGLFQYWKVRCDVRPKIVRNKGILEQQFRNGHQK